MIKIRYVHIQHDTWGTHALYTLYGHATCTTFTSFVQMWSLDYEKEGALTQKIRSQKSGVCVCVCVCILGNIRC